MAQETGSIDVGLKVQGAEEMARVMGELGHQVAIMGARITAKRELGVAMLNVLEADSKLTLEQLRRLEALVRAGKLPQLMPSKRAIDAARAKLAYPEFAKHPLAVVTSTDNINRDRKYRIVEQDADGTALMLVEVDEYDARFEWGETWGERRELEHPYDAWRRMSRTYGNYAE